MGIFKKLAPGCLARVLSYSSSVGWDPMDPAPKAAPEPLGALTAHKARTPFCRQEQHQTSGCRDCRLWPRLEGGVERVPQTPAAPAGQGGWNGGGLGAESRAVSSGSPPGEGGVAPGEGSRPCKPLSGEHVLRGLRVAGCRAQLFLGSLMGAAEEMTGPDRDTREL